MSRHRSPSGRHAHPRPDEPAVAVPGAQAAPRAAVARHRAARQAAVRNGMTAAAATGGMLAVVVPTVGVTTGPADAADAATVLRLAADADAAETGVRLLASVVPVADVGEPVPPEVDVSGLLKAAGLGDVARKAEEERAARAAAADCDAGLSGLGRVKPWVRAAARFLSCLYDQPDLIGVAGRSRHSDHPTGLAVDFMARGQQGDRIAACALRNMDELGITYVIWKQRVNYGDGWERMEDRGGVTENHYDHVHVSFERSAPAGNPVAERCE